MVIGCEAELYLHKLQAETKRVSELTRSISERSQSRLTWSRACAPCTCLAHFGRTCTGLDRGVSGDPVRGGRAELLVLCGGRDEQQASQPPIWRDGNRTCFFFFFLPDHHSLFFFLFSGTLAGTKFRQEDTIQGTKFRQEDTIQGTKSDKETCRSGSHSGCGPFVNSIGKRSGCLAQINQSPAQMNLKQQGARP
jgi:hypothetical protein